MTNVTALSVEEAQKKILDYVRPIKEVELLGLDNLLDRVLAEDVMSPLDVPPKANSAMDGYAVSSNDVGTPPCVMPVTQVIAAGSTSTPLLARSAARIFTGAEIPEGCDAVVIQENTEIEANDQVRILQKAKAGDNIRPQGQDIAKGSLVVEQGTQLLAQHIGVLASMGLAAQPVFRRPKVALLSTGNELCPPGVPLGAGQIYNSNLFMLKSMLNRMQCEVDTVALVKDTLQDTTDALQQFKQSHDLVISTGGVSVGDEDHVKPAVERVGQLHMWKVKLKPGKPLAFGQLDDHCLFMGLPGNPVSAFVTFLLFACPLLKKLKGCARFFAPMDSAHLLFNIDKKRNRPEFLRVRRKAEGLERYSNQSSGVLRSTIWADTLALIPEHTELKIGDSVQCIDIERFYRA